MSAEALAILLIPVMAVFMGWFYSRNEQKPSDKGYIDFSKLPF